MVHADRGSLLYPCGQRSALSRVRPLPNGNSFMSRMRGHCFPLISKQVMIHRTVRTVCKFTKAGDYMHYIVGIDVAKRSHEAIIMDEEGTVVQKSFSIANNCTGYNKLLEFVRRVTRDRAAVTFGMESTGHYWLPLYTRLKKEGYQVYVINPIQSDALRGMYLRQTKTDSRDSFIIADVIRFGRFSEANVPQEKLHALRELCRNRFFMVDSVSDVKRKLTALVDQCFPEYETMFSSMFVESSIAVLAKYPTPEKLSHANLSTLTSVLQNASSGRFGQGKAIQLRETAKNSFGVPDSCGCYASLISCYIKQIHFMKQQIDEVTLEIARLLEEMNPAITSIPGIGPVLGAVILSEIGDVARFKSAEKLAAFAGIDPTVKQSGDFVGTRNHMSKRGSPYLRRAIWMASSVAVLRDPMFHAYYEKKSAEGMRHMKIIGHVTKKMACVIFAVLRDNKDYTPCIPISIS